MQKAGSHRGQMLQWELQDSMGRRTEVGTGGAMGKVGSVKEGLIFCGQHADVTNAADSVLAWTMSCTLPNFREQEGASVLSCPSHLPGCGI